MKQNYFKKLIKYMKEVYSIDHLINTVSDERVNPSYKTGDVILPVLLGFLFRIKSFNELQFMLKENEFSSVITRGKRLPMIDTIRDTLKVINLDSIEYINDYIVRKAIDNKVFADGTIDGFVVAAMDGTKIYGSSKKCCEKCLSYESAISLLPL